MSPVLPRTDWTGLDADARRAWLAALRPAAPEADVAAIVAEVRDRGDAALRELTARFDGVDLESAWLDPDAIERHPSMPSSNGRWPRPPDRSAATTQTSATRCATSAGCAPRPASPPGGAGSRWSASAAYVPGGRAAYASSVLMVGIPAELAGVDDVIVATPPDRNGSVAASILVAARIAGVRRILRAGGAQAIAALAYGTASVPAVDKILGAGNAYVTAAKRLVSDRVAIDLPAGPSEAVVLADGTADPELVALDLLAQAEHGPDSVAVVVSTRCRLLDAVNARAPRGGRRAVDRRPRPGDPA